MNKEEIVNQILVTWRRHQDILLYLLEEVPEEGLTAKPAQSRGRDVARQFAHINRVRLGWLHHHETGERPKLPRFDKGPPPTKEELHEMLASSGKDIEEWLKRALNGETAPRMFGKIRYGRWAT